MQEKWEKFAYIKNFYYLCTRFLKGVLRALSLERFLWSGLRNVGWSNHSAPIEHPLSIHWDKAERSWKGGDASLSICRLVIGVNAKNLSSDVCPKLGTKADPALSITPKTTTGIQCRDNKQRTPVARNRGIATGEIRQD